MKFTKVLLISSMLLSPLSAVAGEASVKFGDLKKFTDVRPSNEGRSSYHKRVERKFTEQFQELAEKLPEGFKLGVTVKDIDLAGDVRFGTANEMRVVKPIYYPKIEFSFALTDNNGKVVNKGDAELKDMSFMDKVYRGREDRKEFSHDLRLISDWFDKEILPLVNQ